MKISTIATQKGGAGKTTLATNLAVVSAKKGYVTMLIDADSRRLSENREPATEKVLLAIFSVHFGLIAQLFASNERKN